MKRIALLTVLTLGSFLPAALPAKAYTYTNPRYGTSASFPAEAFPRIMPPSPSGEGQGWRSDEGAEIVIYALENQESRTPRSLIQWRRSLDKVTYQRWGRDWAVVSGFRPDGRIFYERYIFRGGLIHSVSIRYPQSERGTYDRLVGPITNSLRGSNAS